MHYTERKNQKSQRDYHEQPVVRDVVSSMDDVESKHTDKGNLHHNERTACAILDLECARRGQLTRSRAVDEAVEPTSQEEYNEEAL